MGGHGLAWAGVGCHGLQRYPVARACFPRDNNRLGKHGPRLQSSLTYSAKLAPISLHAIHHLRLDVVPLRFASHPYRDAVPRSTAVPPRALAPSLTTPLASAPTHVAVPRRMSRGPNRIWDLGQQSELRRTWQADRRCQRAFRVGAKPYIHGAER
jgi:hypothetical protein